MKTMKVDISAGRLFPFQFLVLAGIFMFAGVMLMPGYPVMAVILLLLGLMVLTAYEGTEVDTATKMYREYYSFCLIKQGKFRKYASIERIVIRQAKISQKMFSPRTLGSSTFTHIEFHAYLRFQGGEEVFLKSDRNKMRLLKKINGIARALNTTVLDKAGAG